MIAQKFTISIEPKTAGSFTITIDKGSRLPLIPQEMHADFTWKNDFRKMLREQRQQAAISIANAIEMHEPTLYQVVEGPNQTVYEFHTPQFGRCDDYEWHGYEDRN